MSQVHRCPACRRPFNSAYFVNLHYQHSPECAPPPVLDPEAIAAADLEKKVSSMYSHRGFSMRTIATKTGITRARVRVILAKLGYVSDKPNPQLSH